MTAQLQNISNQDNNTNKLFPVFLKLENLPLLIVGGGYVALEKLTAVLQNSPATKITMVGTTISHEIKSIAATNGNIVLEEKPYETTDLAKGSLVIVAVNDKQTSKIIYEEAKAKGLLVNVADTPDLCDFYLSSVVRKGNLKIAVSTNGKSPTIAKRVKEFLNELVPEEIDELLDNMQEIRNNLKGNFEEKVKQLNELTKSLSNSHK